MVPTFLRNMKMDHIGKRQTHGNLLKLDEKSQTDYENKTELDRLSATKKNMPK